MEKNITKALTCGKHIGMPPRIAFGGLKIACKKQWRKVYDPRATHR